MMKRRFIKQENIFLMEYEENKLRHGKLEKIQLHDARILT